MASERLARRIILNTINPGPVNTDPARLIGWLAAGESRWIVGQVLTTDGGLGP